MSKSKVQSTNSGKIQSFQFSSLKGYILHIKTLFAEVVKVVLMGEIPPDHGPDICINVRLSVIAIAIL